MVIDIIGPSDHDFSQLSHVQYDMIYAAQEKKNEVLRKAAEEKQKLFLEMLARGVARSTARSDAEARIDAAAQEEIGRLREDLLHQITADYYADGNEKGVYIYPSNPDYSLVEQARYHLVEDYYMKLTSDPAARLEAFENDWVAPKYLGKFYETLHERLRSYVS